MPLDSPGSARLSGAWPSTLWSAILLAGDPSSPQTEAALAALCHAYWYPLYVYIRKQVESAQKAEDLTQAFFTRLLEKNVFAAAQQGKGRFRAFLLACCKNFLANQHDHEQTLKRGGGQTILPFDLPAAENRYAREPADTMTPERLFQRRWALTLLDHVLERLRQEFHDAGKAALFVHLESALLGEHSALSHAAIGRAVGLSEDAVKKAAQRLRQRYREVLREEIAHTVDGAEAVEEEIRDLLAILAS
jgi:DNA-directed RNA polymerase specialized sigma24 family protein